MKYLSHQLVSFNKYNFFILLFAFCYFSVQSQNDKKLLQENKKKIEQEIRFTNQLLKETKKR